ncbi:BHLH domain-containing protein [Caerostris extrusa]|uniref:BHLH domain-containing protein n=1 Tax=Caerostris extrusa TaxID=172846 RepID=A0AAV4SJ82_CAEEX|nr:BHLH domain-containing protein [Caerostris extrusa]
MLRLAAGDNGEGDAERNNRLPWQTKWNSKCYTIINTTLSTQPYSDGNYSPSSSPVSITSSTTPVPSPGHSDNANAIRTFYDLTNCSPMKMVNSNTAFVFPENNLLYKGNTSVHNVTRPARHYSPIALRQSQT